MVQAEEATGRNHSKTLYRIVKDLSGKAAPRIPVTGSDWKALKSQKQEAQRWKQHFQDILNCPESAEVHDFRGDCINALDISTADITIEEVKKAIKKLMNGKATDVDGVQAELLKYGVYKLARRVTTLCNRIWITERYRKTGAMESFSRYPRRCFKRLQQLERSHTAVCTGNSYVQYYSGQNKGLGRHDTSLTTGWLPHRQILR